MVLLLITKKKCDFSTVDGFPYYTEYSSEGYARMANRVLSRLQIRGTNCPQPFIRKKQRHKYGKRVMLQFGASLHTVLLFLGCSMDQLDFLAKLLLTLFII